MLEYSRFGSIFLFLVFLTCPGLISGCHYTTIIIQNGTRLNTTGWARNAIYGLNIYREPRPHSTNQTFSGDNPVIIPNPDQDCICGGYGITFGGIKKPKGNSSNSTPGKTKKPTISAKTSWERAAKLGVEKNTTAYRYFLAKLVIHKMMDREQFVCTGTLINAKFILSVAHCFCGYFMPCKGGLGGDENRMAIDEDNFFNPKNMSGKAGLEIFIGFMEGSTEAVTGPDPIFARKIVVHPKYKQDRDLIGDFDLALIETRDFIERNSAIQPICLPPEPVLSEEQKNGIIFEDVDCNIISSRSPFPMVTTPRDVLVCPPTEKFSLINGFDDISGATNLTCKTNLFGAVKNSPCLSPCKKNSNYFPKKCDELVKAAIDQGIDRWAQKFVKTGDDGQKLECFYKVDYSNLTGLGYQMKNIYEYGWCKACPDDSVRVPCEDGSGTICCRGADGQKGKMSWGFCDSNCDVVTPVPSEPSGAHFHEIKAQTFPSSTDFENICDVGRDEFCTGIQTGPLVSAEFDSSNKFQKFLYEPLRRDHAELQFTTSCYGDVGGPVWKKEVIILGDRAAELAVLTGVVSRHEGRCSTVVDKNTIVEVSVHVRVREVLDWIKKQTIVGTCGDKEVFQVGWNTVTRKS